MQLETGRTIFLIALLSVLPELSSSAPTLAPGVRQPTTMQVGEQTSAADAETVLNMLRGERLGTAELKQLYSDHRDAWKDADSRQQPQAMWLLAICDLTDVTRGEEELTFKRLRLAADAGFAPALLTIGEMYYNAKDFDRAMRYYLAAADGHESSANVMIGVMHLLGQGVPKNETEAASWYRKGAEQGHTGCMWRYGQLLILGTGVKTDVTAGLDWVRKSAEAADRRGMAIYGMMLLQGGPDGSFPADAAKGIVWVRKSAEAGYADAMFELFLQYGNGKSVARDDELSEGWLKRAANAGHPKAKELVAKYGLNRPQETTASQFSLARSSSSFQPAQPETGWRAPGGQLVGVAPPSDPAGAAIRYYSSAAADGNVQAMVELASRIEQGIGIRSDPAAAFSWNVQAAQLGSPVGMVRVAHALSEGKIVQKNEPQAHLWLLQAAQQGWLDAIVEVARRYHDGIGTSRNLTEAAKWFQIGAEKGNTYAMVSMSNAYLNGEGVKVDVKRALELSQRAAETAEPSALAMLATFYRTGAGIPQEFSKAVNLFRRAAELGSVPAMMSLADMASHKEGLSPIEEVPWLMRASESNDPTAMMKLGQRYLVGASVMKDEPKGVELIRSAAKADKPEACFMIGQVYEIGQAGVKADLPTAIDWYLRGTILGDGACMNEMGRLCQSGTGMRQDAELAAEWYRRASRAGCALAETNLGWMYASGTGVEKDLDRAFRCFVTAAQANEPSAMLQIGVMYLNGIGIPKDADTATVWIRMAAQRGNAQAQDILKSNGLSW